MAAGAARRQLKKTRRRAASHKKLAQNLGSKKVENRIQELEAEEHKAAKAQKAAPKARASTAKKMKSRGYIKRKKGAYSSSDLAMEAF